MRRWLLRVGERLVPLVVEQAGARMLQKVPGTNEQLKTRVEALERDLAAHRELADRLVTTMQASLGRTYTLAVAGLVVALLDAVALIAILVG